MANLSSNFTNNDHNVIRIKFYTSGVENMRLYRGQSDNIRGPSGDNFSYAWKPRDEEITDAEMQAHGATASYGDNIHFGSPPGHIP